MMLSIIICSRSKWISSSLYENIKDTIGCGYELVVVDNSENQYSIFEAYNLGAEKSIGEFLCFVHEDVIFHTKGWGNEIRSIFLSDKQIGLIGVAGAKVKSKMPSAWWDCPGNMRVVHIIQHIKDKEKEKWDSGFDKNKIVEVAVIDGVFIAMKNNNALRFNSKMQGFHNYDLNISFECKKQGLKIIVTNRVLLEHFSKGTINADWVNSTYKLHELYKGLLPLGMFQRKLEIANAINFIKKSLAVKMNKVALDVWIRLLILHPLSKFHPKFLISIVKSIF